ncbi:hypothetical protein GOBAR_AA30349 [Gossypium barbadense]|uniref:Uncharacterized protein n=1 Tax=Gossypium barbadense TaxID=3634 RepID=A0A2P5WGZ9_GOSBA|nr:hypothetical protein GOBAR_AA30349 [Gossypium barbadense]
MDFGPIAFDNESGSGFGLEMEKSNCGAKNLRLNTIRKRIGTVVFNISLNLLRNKNKKRKNIAFELSLVVASQLITITYCFLNHRHFREPSPHPLKSLCPLSYSNNSNVKERIEADNNSEHDRRELEVERRCCSLGREGIDDRKGMLGFSVERRLLIIFIL